MSNEEKKYVQRGLCSASHVSGPRKIRVTTWERELAQVFDIGDVLPTLLRPNPVALDQFERDLLAKTILPPDSYISTVNIKALANCDEKLGYPIGIIVHHQSFERCPEDSKMKEVALATLLGPRSTQRPFVAPGARASGHHVLVGGNLVKKP